jgi:hypothetical protein
MSTIAVKTSGRPFICTVDDSGHCKFCGRRIIWATTPNGKKIPLEPWDWDQDLTESHFGHCGNRNNSRYSEPPPPPPPPPPPRWPEQGVRMTDTVWRRLLLLIHPDKHHGGEAESLATEMTRWLLEQRSRLTREDK